MTRIGWRILGAGVILALLCSRSGWAQSEIGNRANGLSYQPTPAEVVPLEQSSGVRPSTAHQNATDHELERLDRRLLQNEGMSTSSVPTIPPTH